MVIALIFGILAYEKNAIESKFKFTGYHSEKALQSFIISASEHATLSFRERSGTLHNAPASQTSVSSDAGKKNKNLPRAAKDGKLNYVY